MTVRLKLTMGSIVAILVANALISLAVVTYLESAWLTEVQTRVRMDLNSGRFAYQTHLRHVAAFLEASALSEPLVTAAGSEDSRRLPSLLRQICRLAPMDFLTVLDARGKVICRARQAEAATGPTSGATGSASVVHDDLSQNSLVAAVLKKRQAAVGTQVMSAAALASEGEELAARARIELMPTPEARPTTEQRSTDGLVVAAAVPLMDAAGKLQGVLYGGDLLNHRDDLVDHIRDAVSSPSDTAARPINTVTIFLGDLRIATNVPRADGTRAVGTRMSREVADEVLDRGGIWTGPARVLNDWYIAAYEPIRDPQEKIVGALYVGLLRAPFLHRRNTLTGVILVMVASGAAACIFLIFFLDYLVLRPARKVIQMAQRVMGGDLTARVKIRPPGEIGILCRAIDHMADNLAEREKQLKAATSKQLGGSEKLASLGRLAAGVAHEINNPLTGVLTFAHLLREKANMDEQDQQDLDLIIHETTRAAEIVRGLLDFARERAVVMEPLNINEVIARTIRLIRNQKLFDRIVITEELANNLPDIEGDMNQLQQVLLNLSLNACEAMPSGGTLTIRTWAEENRVVVQLADTGCGIKPEHFERIFEPFFTTKPVGKGTGLGLSVSYGILQRHGGAIELESEEGKGTTFILLLPALGREPIHETPQSVPREHPFLAKG
jgi:two-component system NtrC family sensor kinase